MWAKKHGIAVVHTTFIASKKCEMTALAGDTIEVYDAETNWFLGTNLLTKKSGIFPNCIASFTSCDSVRSKEYLGSDCDLLVHESFLTLYEALSQYKTLPASYAVSVFESISDIVSILDKYHDPNQQRISEIGHSLLGMKVKQIRDAFGYPEAFRCSNYTPVTLSNWSLNHFLTKYIPMPTRIPDPSEHPFLHLHLSVLYLTQPRHFRIALWSPNNAMYLPWVSQPISIILTPEKNEVDLEFNDLEDELFNGNLSLVIYYDNVKQEKNSHETRTPIGCSILKLPFKPPCEKTITVSDGSYLTPPEFQHNVHTLLAARTQADFTPGPLDFVAKGNVFYESEITTGSSAIHVPLLKPISLESKSRLSLQIDSVSHDANRLITYIVRLLNYSKKQFESVFLDKVENNELRYKSDHSSSLIIKSSKDAYFDEIVTLDLASIEADLSDLYIVVEVQRSGLMGSSLSSLGFAYIKLTDPSGAITQSLSSEAQIHSISYRGDCPQPKDFNFEKPGKTVGSIKYKIDLTSDHLTNNKTIHSLLNYKSLQPNSLQQTLDEFSALQITNYYPFLGNVLLSLCNIISKIGESSVSALFDFVAKASAPKSLYMLKKSFDMYIFPGNGQNGQEFKGIHAFIFKELQSRIDCKKEFSASLLQSISILPIMIDLCNHIVSNEKGFAQNAFGDQVKIIFKQIGDIMMTKVSDDKPEIAKAQKLILEILPQTLDNLIPLLSPENAALLFTQFYQTLRKDISANDRLEFLISFTKTNVWLDTRAREKVKNCYSQEIKAYKTDPKNEQQIMNLLASVFFTARDQFSLNFSDLYEHYAEVKRIEVITFLLCILYQFPKKINIDLAFKILSSQMIDSPIQSFLTIFFLQENIDRLTQFLKDPSKQRSEKLNIFIHCLSSASFAKTPYGIPIDYKMLLKIYNISDDFSALTKLYSQLPSETLDPVLLNEIIHAYSHYESPDLHSFFFKIISNDYSINKSLPRIMNTLFPLLRKSCNLPRFTALVSLFKSDRKEFSTLCEDAVTMIIGMNSIAKVTIGPKTEYELIGQTMNLFKVAEKSGCPDICIEMLCNVVQCNEQMKNPVEQAFSLFALLEKLPCSNEEKKSIGKESAKSTRLIYIETLWKIVQLLMTDHQDEFALNALKIMKEKCVIPFKHFELLPEIYKTEAEIYRKIARNPRTFSSYYRVIFKGGKDDCKDSGKSFIYRRSFTPINQFLDELKTIYPGAEVHIINEMKQQKDEKSDKLTISVEPVFPSSELEDKNPLYHPDTNRPDYITKFEENNFPTLFRSEASKDSREFIHTAMPIPTYVSRVEITQTKVVPITPLEAACLSAIKETNKLNSTFYDKHTDLTQRVLNLSRCIIVIKVRDLAESIKVFMTPEYFEKNKKDQETIREFGRILKNLLGTLDKFLRDVSTSIQDSAPQTTAIYESAKSDYSIVEKMIDDAFKQTFPKGI